MSVVGIQLVSLRGDMGLPDGMTSADPKIPIEVVAQGRFYYQAFNQNTVGRLDEQFPQYDPGTYGARLVILFHELAHKLKIPQFLSDGLSVQQSMKNTDLLLQHCVFPK